MSIILLPFKIVFLILTFLLKGVLYILSYTIIFFSDFCGAIHYIIRLGNGIFAIGGTIVVVGRIQEGSFTGFEGGLLIAIVWLVAMSFSIMFDLGNAIADFLENIGDWLGNLALRFLHL